MSALELCDGLSPTCVQPVISEDQEIAGLNIMQNGNIICVPDTWNQKAGSHSGNSLVHLVGSCLMTGGNKGNAYIRLAEH
jgi:hypothetical protein